MVLQEGGNQYGAPGGLPSGSREAGAQHGAAGNLHLRVGKE